MEYTEGQTPLSEEERQGLKIKTITTHGELNEHEQRNIEKAIEWIIRHKFSKSQILSEQFIKELHNKMFNDVWSWSGKFRLSEKNIGVPFIKIGIQLKQLIDDTQFWITNESYPPDEIAVRFSHRIVSIHCFPNGNGRHSRIIADIIMESIFKKEIFNWHQSSLIKAGTIRSNYIAALRAADKGSIKALLEFARN